VPDFVQVVDELPKPPTEKVQTRFLRESFASGSGVYAQERVGAVPPDG
jgi:acyl-coenzyme A synthetase/AMP-(fatty) acid ligase